MTTFGLQIRERNFKSGLLVCDILKLMHLAILLIL